MKYTTKLLNKIHNLQINCHPQMSFGHFNLGYPSDLALEIQKEFSLSREDYLEALEVVKSSFVLAFECSIVNMYYFDKTKPEFYLNRDFAFNSIK